MLPFAGGQITKRAWQDGLYISDQWNRHARS